uniref:Uncharacterized protein n=1 Tax=Angiostrongylus cantonensis TaxID=6313 RepID=A0A0K0DLU7_ANGCA
MTQAEIDHISINRRWCLFDTSVVPSFCTGSDHRLLRAKIRFSNKREKNSLHRPRGKSPAAHDEQTLNEVLFKRAWKSKKDPTEDYELFVEGLKSSVKSASVPQARRSDRISITAKELPENRTKLKLDLTAARLTWLVIIASRRRALQDDLQRYKQKKLLQAAEKRSGLKKRRRDLCDYNVPLSALMDEDGFVKTFRHDMEFIAETFYPAFFTLPITFYTTFLNV